MLRHRHLTSYVIAAVEFAGADEDDATLVSVPPYHIAGVANVLSNVYSAPPDRLPAGLHARALARPPCGARASATPWSCPRCWPAWSSTSARPRPAAPRLRSLAYGGARMPITVLERALRAFPDDRLRQRLRPHRDQLDHRRARARRPPGRPSPATRWPAAGSASVGRLVPGIEVEVRDGEIWVRGEQVSGEYLGIGGALDADGWFPTRDRGWVDDDGYLFIEGRADDTIIRGGENIAPAEVEDVLLAAPGGARGRRGRRCPTTSGASGIAAAVVLRPGASVDADELRAFARERAPLVEDPRRDRLPRRAAPHRHRQAPAPGRARRPPGVRDVNFDLDALVGCLALTDVPGEPGSVEGANLDIGYHRVFGGQILAQILTAAAAASPDKSVKSIQVLFPREGDTSSRCATASPSSRTGAPSAPPRWWRPRTARRSPPPCSPSTPTRTGCTAATRRPRPRRRRRVATTSARWCRGRPASSTASTWATTPPARRASSGGCARPPVGDGRVLHQALLAHATDLTLIGTALRPFDGVSQADTTVTLHTAVTSHSIWFHQPFRVDDWLLVAQHSPVVAAGRAFGRGDVFAGDELVASFAQESMVRRIEPPA